MSELGNAVTVPQMCASHRHELIVHKLQIPSDGPWQVKIVIANVMLWTAASSHKMIWERVGKDYTPQDLSLVLAEIGCLACFDKLAFKRVARLMKTLTSAELADILHGRNVDNPDWPYLKEASSR